MEKKLNNQMVGKGILKRVSERLTERLGKGWSVENLRQMRKFFVTYSQHYSIGANNGRKKQTVSWKFGTQKSQTVSWKLKSATTCGNFR